MIQILLAVLKIRQFGSGMLLDDDHDLIWVTFLEAFCLGAPIFKAVSLSIRFDHQLIIISSFNNYTNKDSNSLILATPIKYHSAFIIL